jgi:hypothetical protein
MTLIQHLAMQVGAEHISHDEHPVRLDDPEEFLLLLPEEGSVSGLAMAVLEYYTAQDWKEDSRCRWGDVYFVLGNGAETLRVTISREDANSSSPDHDSLSHQCRIHMYCKLTKNEKSK